MDNYVDENRLRDFIDVSTDWFWETDADDRFTFFSGNHKKLTGIHLETKIGKTREEIIQHNSYDSSDVVSIKALAEIAEKIADHEPFKNCRYWITGDDGERHNISVSGKPYFDGAGNYAGYRGIGVDCTAGKQAEDTIFELQHMYEQLVEISPDAIVLQTTEKGRIAFANKAAYDLLGIDYSESLVGADFIDFLNEEGRDSALNRNKKVLTEKITLPITSGIFIRSDGVTMSVERSVTPCLYGGKPAFISLVRDVSDKVEAEEKLQNALVDAERANQAKSKFLATMSHELRTPLNAIIGFSDMLRGQYFGDLGSDKYSEYANDIQASGTHLLNLVNDILDLSAIEAGERSLSKGILFISDLVDESSPMVLELARRKGIEYTVEVPDSLSPLQADRRAIMQILLNLLNNAIKFTPEGGEVTLSVRDGNPYQIITILDTGEGIPDDEIETLTKPFARGESDYHKAQEGTGLGLSIVKSLVEFHQGELSIESELGKGTVVTVKLPSEVT